MSSKEVARSPEREVDPGLRVWNWSLLWSIVVAVLGGLGLIALGYVVVGRLVEVGDEPISPAQRFTAAFAVATAMGVLVALVVNVRKQSLAEQAATREITAAFTERFRAAAEQLGGESPPERLAGVYAMAALADEYPTRRQQCVDVLCGYLRLPFDPATDHLAARSTTSTRTGRDGRAVTTTESPASRPFDQQVRETVMTVIADHTRSSTGTGPGPWSSLSYNFNGAHLINVHLAHCVFAGPRSSFEGATFSGDQTSFREATFSGNRTSFEGATFSGYETSFERATFSGGLTRFTEATFSGGETLFEGATFSGDETSFDEATFSGFLTTFTKATFSGDQTSFREATFSGGMTTFDGATFSAGLTTFSEATFSGSRTWFDEATFSGDQTWFDEATFSGDLTSFEGATFSAKETSFNNATFIGVALRFDGAVREAGAVVTGLDDADLRNGASIMKDGQAFRGWEEP